MTQESTNAALAGGGEMGALIRALDWSKTALGPVSEWPQSLRTSVSLCLSSTFPILIAWGPERIQIYNDAYRPICGDKHPASMGQAFNECWASALPAVGHVLDRAQAGTGSYIENLRMFLDRHGYLEEAFMTFSFSPIRDESGNVGGLFHPITEVTDKMLGERRTSALQHLAQRLGDAKTVGVVWDVTAKAHERLALDAPFLGFYRARPGDTAELLGLAGLSSPAVMGVFERAFTATHETIELDIAHLAIAAGPYEETPRQAVVIPIYIAGGATPFGWLVAGVSSRRVLDTAYRAFFDSLGSTVATALSSVIAYEQEQQRAEALAQIDRAKTAFFSNVSHEFRTPLTLMLGPTEDALASPQRSLTGDKLESVHRNGLRLLKLVNTLLDFSRIEAGRLQAAFVLTDLGQLTAELASNFRSLIERAGLRLEVDTPSLDAQVFVDRSSWEKIVLNLLSNAFKFTHIGEIRVGLRREGDSVVMTVRDSGVGIPAAELSRVFERFHRIEGTHGRSYEGSGIGLALVRELVALHSGTIVAESTVGTGTTFTVSLPLGSGHLPPDQVDTTPRQGLLSGASAAYLEEARSWIGAPAETPAVLPGPNAAHVLLADDNADMRAYVYGLLLHQGWRVTTAADGRDALTKARALAPDLVLTDVMMPGLDGFGLLRELRATDATRHIPVMLLSARAGEEARVEGLAAGADAYLVKPFAAKELIAQVAARLDVARVDKQLRTVADELRESHVRKDEFLAMLAHELRNPLAAISMALTVIGQNRDGANVSRHLGIAQRQTATLVRLVDDLLDVSRITRGAFELRRAIVDFKTVVTNAIAGVRNAIESRGHTLAVNIEPGVYAMNADETRLEQVVINVITNAVKYTEPHGRISVSLASAPNGSSRKAVLRIRDNGRGIPADKLGAIFDLFYQVDTTIDRASGGLGLGLSLVRRLVDMHAGRVVVTSEGAGHGTEVLIELPLREGATVIEHAPQNEPPSSVEQRRVLIVEDEDDVRDSLKAVIEHLGHTVSVASTGEAGIAAILEHRHDIAFVDLGLPGVDGLEVARRVRSAGAAVHLVALTGYGGSKAASESRKAGYDAHLVKPIDIDTITTTLSRLRTTDAVTGGSPH